jgi:hypothetical protein
MQQVYTRYIYLSTPNFPGGAGQRPREPRDGGARSPLRAVSGPLPLAVDFAVHPSFALATSAVSAYPSPRNFQTVRTRLQQLQNPNSH